MIDFIAKLFAADFMPHKMCYLEDASVLWLNAVSDSAIALCYFLIPFLLLYFTRKRRDIGFRWIFAACGAFILACGASHMLGVVTVWNPVYRLEGAIKAITAAASAATLIMLTKLMPQLLAIPRPAELAELNRQLAREVEERRAAEAELSAANQQLEDRVARRTAELAHSESRFRELAETMPQMIWMAGPDGADDYHNRQWAEFTGVSPSQPGGPAWNSIVHPDDRSATQTQWDACVRTGDPFEAEFRLRGKDGSYHWFLGRARPIHGESGRILRWFGACTDIDDQKRANEDLGQTLQMLRSEMKRRHEVEDQLIHAQKMEAVGRLAGGVAHDFNNLLTVILGNNEMLREEVRDNAMALEFVDEILRAAQRASGLTNQLLAFSRRQVSIPRLLDLNDVVRQIDRMLRRIIGEDVELQVRLAPDLPPVCIDRSQIDQVIMNLAVNSRDAMPHGGRLSLETAVAELREDELTSRLGLRPGRHVVLSVSDNGCGMDAATKSRLFEPFFTTKEKGKGTGLGLSMVYGIVKQHQGDIAVFSEPGQGAMFKIYFPAADGAIEQPLAPTAAAASPAQTAAIMLVEDEDQVRNLTRAILVKLGYRVFDAGSPAAAMEISRESAQMIDLLLTDIVMPGMSGVELAKKLTAARPGLKVMFMSGYTDTDLVPEGMISADSQFIQKPFTTNALQQKILEALHHTS